MFYPFSVYGQYHAKNMPLLSRAISSAAKNGEKTAKACLWKLRKKPLRAIVSPKQSERVTLFSMRLGFGAVGTFMGGLFTTEYMNQNRPQLALMSALTSIYSLTSGLGKTSFALDANRNFVFATSDAIDDHDSAKEFLVKTVEFSLARRAIAGAQLLTHAEWKDLSLAVEIAEYCTKDLINSRAENKPKALKDRRTAAIEISKLVESVDATHDHYDLLLAIEKATHPVLSLGDRT